MLFNIFSIQRQEVCGEQIWFCIFYRLPVLDYISFLGNILKINELIYLFKKQTE
jgi:hypothetical protein